jgi:ribonucleoside-diphosphate reductase alpha chain
VPSQLKALYASAFEIDPSWLIDCAARRQKWIDQAQSLNLYLAQPNGKKLDDMYKLAWTSGLKTTYYLRTTSATTAEKSTVASTALNAVPTGLNAVPIVSASVCSITDPTCESCQ